MRLIDADALLLKKYGEGETDSYEVVDVDDILDAQTVDAEPVRHGRWDSFGVKKTDARGRKRIEYMFNACVLCENPAAMRTAYYPNCGAKMDAEVQDG